MKEKAYCVYCGYANGVINYWRAVVGETEKYFCSIKHKENGDFVPPGHHKNFLEYSDKDSFIEQYGTKRTRYI